MLRNTEAKGFENFLDKNNELEVIYTELRDEVRSLKNGENIRKHDFCYYQRVSRHYRMFPFVMIRMRMIYYHYF